MKTFPLHSARHHVQHQNMTIAFSTALPYLLTHTMMICRYHVQFFSTHLPAEPPLSGHEVLNCLSCERSKTLSSGRRHQPSPSPLNDDGNPFAPCRTPAVHFASPAKSAMTSVRRHPSDIAIAARMTLKAGPHATPLPQSKTKTPKRKHRHSAQDVHTFYEKSGDGKQTCKLCS